MKGRGPTRGPGAAFLPLDEAISVATGLVRPIEAAEFVRVLEGLRRIVATDVRALVDVPSSDRAAMDGYAVIARDTSRARPSRPVVLRRTETLYASSVPTMRVKSGRCAEIATGATVPGGADAVVMVEDTESEEGLVQVSRVARTGQNVVRRGSDIKRGAVVVRSGEVLTPARLGALAAIGAGRVRVFRKPRVGILTTGEEVATPGRRIRPGQVYDINSWTVSSVVREQGGEPIPMGRAADRPEAIRAAIERAAAASDLVVVSGGSSVGKRDLVVSALRSMGDVLFHGIAVKPGRPTALARVRGTPILGMPGNPTSCLSNAVVLLTPMLRKMARLPVAHDRAVELPLAQRIVSMVGRAEVHTVRIAGGRAVPAYKGSAAITSMAHADGYILVPASAHLVEKGEVVRVVLF